MPHHVPVTYSMRTFLGEQNEADTELKRIKTTAEKKYFFIEWIFNYKRFRLFENSCFIYFPYHCKSIKDFINYYKFIILYEIDRNKKGGYKIRLNKINF